MKKLISVLILGLLAPLCYSQLPQPRFEQKPALQSKNLDEYVLKVQVPNPDGSKSNGTGVAVSPRRKDGRYDILTAAHCVGPVDSQVTLFPKSGKALSAYVTARDDKADIAWLVTHDTKLTLPMLALAKSPPKYGSPVRQWGIGGKLLRRGTMKNRQPNGRIDLHLQATLGDSGGPIVCELSNAIIGVQSTNSAPWDRLNPSYDSGAGSCEAAWRIRPTDSTVPPRVENVPKASPVPWGYSQPRIIYLPPGYRLAPGGNLCPP